jgi:hypothetical protein
MIRRLIRIALGIVFLAILSAGAFWAVNAIDEAPTAEARELLQPLALEAAGADNAWHVGIDFRKLPENTPLEGWLRWHALSEPPLGRANAIQPTLQWLLIAKAPLHAQYRLVRDLPRYGETILPTDPIAALSIDSALVDGAGLALAEIALAALDGRLEDAVAELERESAYHRRAVAGSRALLARMIACGAIVRDMLMVSDLLVMHGEKLRPYRERLMRVVAPIPRQDLDLSALYEMEARLTAQMLLQYRRVILHENDAFNEGMLDERRVRTWQAFGYRSQATVNEFARRHDANRKLLKESYEQAWAGRGFPDLPAPPAQASWRLVNPTGYLMLEREGWGGATYDRRMQDVSALVALVRLQAALTLDERKRSAFLKDVARDNVVVLDEPFRSRATFDPGTSSIRYKPWESRGAIGEIAKRFGGELVVPAGRRRAAR